MALASSPINGGLTSFFLPTSQQLPARLLRQTLLHEVPALFFAPPHVAAQLPPLSLNPQDRLSYHPDCCPPYKFQVPRLAPALRSTVHASLSRTAPSASNLLNKLVLSLPLLCPVRMLMPIGHWSRNKRSTIVHTQISTLQNPRQHLPRRNPGQHLPFLSKLDCKHR